ncbi:spore germination protein [Paenibacillus sp. LHD-117]|uniref:spore germination protein n=1 Tax=Paenibacillus sp. LHD-117 TaxID=3071412 RepID=UPI0027DF2CAF|nr:spore germination protein [Paenibacillus sp. LHD-117]MDQ6419527.1 spore germination protein [Paenibacillus sp. LHD-117]
MKNMLLLFGWLLGKKRNNKHKDSVREEGFRKDTSTIEQKLDVTVERIRRQLGNSPDLIIRYFAMANFPHVPVAAVYMEGLTDTDKINEFTSSSIMEQPEELENQHAGDRQKIFEAIWQRSLTVGDVKMQHNWNDMLYALLSGDTVIMVDGCAGSIIANLRGGERRDISEPITEVNIRGPRDSFTESIGTNVSLIRRRLKSPNLWLETMRIGTVSQTEVSMLYLHGIADDKLVEEVRSRLKDIQVDAVLESGIVEQLIEDETLTPFPTVYNTERPDIASCNLLEGRIAVLVDGTPNTLILPTTFSHFFKAADDYYQRADFAVFLRMIRYFSFFILILLPSAYIAVTTHHQEMIPTPLAINLLAQREGVPLPVLFEAMLMEVAFEIIREAGTRMPRAIGQAVSIVGAIVLGQAAVEAGIVTAMMVIIVAFTGIASFTIPGFTLSTSSRIIRFPMMIAAATFGFYGVIMGVILLVAHLASLRSFGTPYLSPFAPFGLNGQKDTLLRVPNKMQENRSQSAKGGGQRES